MASGLPSNVNPIKNYEAIVNDEKIPYMAYTGPHIPPPGEWGTIGDIYQDDATKPTRVWFHDGDGCKEGMCDTTPHPVHDKKFLLGLTWGTEHWLNPTTIRTRKSKLQSGKGKKSGSNGKEKDECNDSGASSSGGGESPAPGEKRRVSREEEADEDREKETDLVGWEGTPVAKQRKGEEGNGEINANDPSGNEQGEYGYFDIYSVTYQMYREMSQ